MKALLIGAGGVGEALAKILQQRDPGSQWLEKLVVSDYNTARAQEVSAMLNAPERFPPEHLDAENPRAIKALAHKHQVDLIVNATAADFNKPIFDAAFEAGARYIDLGTYSIAHPEEPYTKGYKLWMAQYQFEKSRQWEEKGLLAITGCGIDPGTVDVFAKYAEKHLFDELEEIQVRDGNNFEVAELDLVFGFSVVTVIEECLSPPVFWDRDRGWYVKEPMADPEIFELPEGMGRVEMVAVEHEEVIYMPKYIDKGLQKVSFKIQLGQELTDALKYLRALGLDSSDKVAVEGVEVAPIDVVAATAPDPARIGDKIKGKICVGASIIGKKDGKSRNVFIYQMTDNHDTMEKFNTQAVVTQTAYGPAITMELLARGKWHGTGVHAPEAFDPEPYLLLMDEYDFAYRMEERASEYKAALDAESFKEGLRNYRG